MYFISLGTTSSIPIPTCKLSGLVELEGVCCCMTLPSPVFVVDAIVFKVQVGWLWSLILSTSFHELSQRQYSSLDPF